MNVAYINPIIGATKHVIDTMIHVPLMVGQPQLRDRQRQCRIYKVSAAIQLAGSVAGQIVVSFTQGVALALADGLIGEQHREIDADCLDALGEVANMIAGCAKKELGAGLVSISTPKLVPSGQISYPLDMPFVVFPFDTAKGRFIVEIGFKEQAKDANVSGA